MRLLVTVVHRHGCLKSVLHWNPECFVPRCGRAHHVRGLVCGCARCQITHRIFPGCEPQKGRRAGTPRFPNFSAPVPAHLGPLDFRRARNIFQGWYIGLSLFSPELRWHRRHAQGNLSYTSTGAALSTTCMSFPPRAVVSVTSHMRRRDLDGEKCPGGQSLQNPHCVTDAIAAEKHWNSALVTGRRWFWWRPRRGILMRRCASLLSPRASQREAHPPPPGSFAAGTRNQEPGTKNQGVCLSV